MDINLNPPQIKGELMESIKNRHTSRQYNPNKELTLQQLSDLLDILYGYLTEIIEKKEIFQVIIMALIKQLQVHVQLIL